MENDRYIQIGVTSLRDPKTGEHLAAVSMYIKTDAVSEDGLEALTQDVGRLFADRMRRYIAECRAIGVKA